MTAIQSWWRGLTPREHLLLTVAAVLFVVIFGWLGVVRPLLQGRADAADRLATATYDLGEINARVPMIRAAEARARSTNAAPTIETVRRRVADAGLTAETITDDGSGRVSVQVRAVKPAVLLRWLAELETRDNIVADQVAMTRNGDATVAAELGLRRASQ
jgi:general secretion pathway protein M